MEFEIAPELDLELKKIGRKDKKLLSKVERQLLQFLENHKHPSLRLHKLSGNMKGVWSISIDMHLRMLYRISNETAYFFKIGTHDEVYRSK